MFDISCSNEFENINFVKVILVGMSDYELICCFCKVNNVKNYVRDSICWMFVNYDKLFCERVWIYEF